ncbi:MAG: nucleoside recognition domain-containing protein, partial [Thermodesulfobacteriota bacterium]|nr:nucleoside recognition domain-containing protein [Thermodesulfobacteriota bacterium]
PTVGKKGRGKKALRHAIANRTDHCSVHIDYGTMEPMLCDIVTRLKKYAGIEWPCSLRWLSVKLMEGDAGARSLVLEKIPGAENLLQGITDMRNAFEDQADEEPEKHIAYQRHIHAGQVASSCIKMDANPPQNLSDQIDRVVINRWLGPVILVGIIYLMYYLSIDRGYKLTEYTWPILAGIRTSIASILPGAWFIGEPINRSFCLWFIDSINAMLNYIPIFFILFCLIAILEDSGYMPRMSFILDRVLRRFGLHGQSTLPLILGGVFVGGCAIPGVMACKAVPDERSRLATILIVPMMNCLAKVPLYMLLINTYFPEHKTQAFFFIATITLFMALPTAKILTMTVLKNKESAPFIMDLPPYHVPTIEGVLRRAIERLWLFIRKIITVVAIVAVVIFVLLQFPNLSNERMAHYTAQKDQAISTFQKEIKGNPYARYVQTPDELLGLIQYMEGYKAARMAAFGNKEKSKAVSARFKEENPVFFTILKSRKDKAARKTNRAMKKVVRARKVINRDMKKERINNSILGKIGHGMEPITQWAGFSWRINVALLSSFAAKESSVATLGALYQQDAQGAQSMEEGMKKTETGFTPLHALTLMLFMALFPPCIPAAIAVRLQSGSSKWMLFSILVPTGMGLIVASLVFSGGMFLGLSGWQAMWGFYAMAIMITLAMATIKDKNKEI